jgi:hypothetical protein
MATPGKLFSDEILSCLDQEDSEKELGILMLAASQQYESCALCKNVHYSRWLPYTLRHCLHEGMYSTIAIMHNCIFQPHKAIMLALKRASR